MDDFSSKLSKAFDMILDQKYGGSIAPPPLVSSFGIRTLDAVLGGGLGSSLPVIFSSTPESGKSTMAFQFAANFQKLYKNSICVYLDTENASNTSSQEISNIEDRICVFDINRDKFIYKPVVSDIKELFSIMTDLIETKIKFEERIKEEVQLLLIWDSIAATQSSKDISADNPNEIIGFKARELTFSLSKIKPRLAMNKVTFLCIDQVRSNLKIDSPYARAEKTVGDFGNFKAATSVVALQHNVKQWMFFSKGKALNKGDAFGVDGWILSVYTEKNKIAPSNYWISLVFDKKFGVIDFLSEYWFLKEMTPTEKKVYGDEKKLPYPLLITTTNKRKVLEIIDPTTGSIQYTSEPFFETKFVDMYNNNLNFQSAFSRAVELSIDGRIKKGYFNISPPPLEVYSESDVSSTIQEPSVDDSFDDSTEENSGSLFDTSDE